MEKRNLEGGCRLTLLIWREMKMPIDWRRGLVCPTYKKGDKFTCSNYRRITLLVVAHKVFSRVLTDRLSTLAEEVVEEYSVDLDLVEVP